MYGRKIVFVVDDEQVIARTLAIILGRAGFDTESFVSAEAALERSRIKRPDVVVSDVVLEGMSGIRLAEVLREQLPETPIMLISGQAHTSELIRVAKQRGHSVSVHPKPIEPTALIAEVNRLLSRSDGDLKALAA